MKFCPGNRRLHLVLHQEKVNVPVIPEVVGGWGFQMTGALVTQYWWGEGGTRHFFLLALYSSKILGGGARAP